MKVTVVGGGSTSTSEFVEGFSWLREALPIDELWLVESNADRLDLVAGVFRWMCSQPGRPGTVPRPAAGVV